MQHKKLEKYSTFATVTWLYNQLARILLTDQWAQSMLHTAVSNPFQHGGHYLGCGWLSYFIWLVTKWLPEIHCHPPIKIIRRRTNPIFWRQETRERDLQRCCRCECWVSPCWRWLPLIAVVCRSPVCRPHMGIWKDVPSRQGILDVWIFQLYNVRPHCKGLLTADLYVVSICLTTGLYIQHLTLTMRKQNSSCILLAELQQLS